MAFCGEEELFPQICNKVYLNLLQQDTCRNGPSFSLLARNEQQDRSLFQIRSSKTDLGDLLPNPKLLGQAKQ